MADGILAAVNENGNIDRFIDTKGGVHYIEPKRYEESVAKIDAAATKAKETVNSATEAVSECKAQTGACTQETARAKEIADTVESRITGIEGDIATLRDSVSRERVSVTGGEATRVGGLVTVGLVNVTLSKGSSRNLGTLPTSMRPSVDYYGTLFFNGSLGYFKVAKNGSIYAYSGPSAGDYTGSTTFPVTT